MKKIVIYETCAPEIANICDKLLSEKCFLVSSLISSVYPIKIPKNYISFSASNTISRSSRCIVPVFKI